MSDALDIVLENMKYLTPSERALAAHCLLISLEERPSDQNVDAAWLNLADERVKALKSGSVQATSWEEIKSKIVK